jgi:hypothetical protein
MEKPENSNRSSKHKAPRESPLKEIVRTLSIVFLKQELYEMQFQAQWSHLISHTLPVLEKYVADYFFGNCTEMLLHTLRFLPKRSAGCVNTLPISQLLPPSVLQGSLAVTVLKIVSPLGLFTA